MQFGTYHRYAVTLWLESVADPGVGDEVFGLCVVGLEFAADVAHVDA